MLRSGPVFCLELNKVNSLGPHAACWAEAWDCQQPAVLNSLVRLASRHHAGYKQHFHTLVLPPKLVIFPNCLWFHDIWVLFVKIWTWMASTNIDAQTSTKNTLTYFAVKPELRYIFMPALLHVLCPYFCLNLMVIHRKIFWCFEQIMCFIHCEKNIWKIKIPSFHSVCVVSKLQCI